MAESSVRMTEGPIGKSVIRFAIPLFLGNLFQQLYNTADALIVGNLLDNRALAAVSSNASLIFLLVGFFQGIFMGAGVVIAQYFGAKDDEKVHKAIHTTLAFSMAAGLFLTLAGTAMTPLFLQWMGTPADVMPASVAYLRVYFLGSLGLVMYNACMGIMQAQGDSRHPLYYLIISSVLNVVLDIVFIAGFGMNVEGAALATILSQFVSVVLCLWRLTRLQTEGKVIWRKVRFHGELLRQIIRYGLPSGLQNSVIAIANVVVQSNINAFGEMAMSGCGAYSKIEGFAFLPITSFTAAITTFVGQNLGAKEFDRAKRGARFGVLCSMGAAQFVGIVVFLAAPLLIRAFTGEAEAIVFGVQKARICALFYFLLAASHCLASVLRGAGLATVPMVAMLLCWCVIRVLILIVVVPITGTIDIVNWVYPITWSMTTVALGVYYFKADWLHSVHL